MGEDAAKGRDRGNMKIRGIGTLIIIKTLPITRTPPP
jgi:hypothetical protein